MTMKHKPLSLFLQLHAVGGACGRMCSGKPNSWPERSRQAASGWVLLAIIAVVSIVLTFLLASTGMTTVHIILYTSLFWLIVIVTDKESE